MQVRGQRLTNAGEQDGNAGQQEDKGDSAVAAAQGGRHAGDLLWGIRLWGIRGDVFLVRADPVRSNFPLGGGKVESAGAYQIVETLFQLVFYFGVPACGIGLGPEVADGFRTAEVGGNEVVDFKGFRVVRVDSVGSEHLALCLGRDMADDHFCLLAAADLGKADGAGFARGDARVWTGAFGVHRKLEDH